jgi:hypothetical protein
MRTFTSQMLSDGTSASVSASFSTRTEASSVSHLGRLRSPVTPFLRAWRKDLVVCTWGDEVLAGAGLLGVT